MTRKTRLIILLVCVACFFIVTPALILYSIGDRFSFEKMKIEATGGIYVRSFPSPDQVIIDSKYSEKPGMFSNSIFIQSLFPKDHSVLVQKNGYYSYSKTIPVEENQVTKLENILLLKKNIKFDIIADESQSPFDIQDKFTIKNNNLYYSNSTENNNITASQKLIPLIKGLAAFSASGNNIIWLGSDGLLYKSDISQTPAVSTKITLVPLKIIDKSSYKILISNQNIFIVGDGNLLMVNSKTSSLENFYTNIKDAKISPDGKNIIYYNAGNIYISSLLKLPADKVILNKSLEVIKNCIWLNNDYIIFTAGDKIIISEIDYRGEINTITLPTTITIAPDKKVIVKTPEIFFNQQSEKLYILTGDTLLLSERLVP